MWNLFKGSKMNRININGVDIVGGRNISIRGNRVVVDGQEVNVNIGVGQQELHIKVLEGSIGTLDAGGSVSCENVTGNVDCGGSANVSGNVGGNVDAGGSVNVGGNCSGSIDAGGSVRIGSR